MVVEKLLRSRSHEVDHGFFWVWLVSDHGHIDLMS